MWYQKDYRRVFMDMHFPDQYENGVMEGENEFLSKLDLDAFIDCLKQVDASSLVVYAKSHVGLHYWPSKTGRMQQGLKQKGLDYFGEMIQKCHENGINVIAYVSQNYDNYAYNHHPSWRMVDENGKTSLEDGGRYGLVCPNNLEYRHYIQEILRELNERYPFEGMFLDMPFWPMVCHCPACRERYFKETGRELPRKEDWNDPNWVEYAHRRQEWMHEFMLENTRVVKDIHPEVSVEHNFSAVGQDWRPGNVESEIDACDYAGGDYYGGYPEQSFMCKYYNNITPNKPFCYITSRCDPNLYFHTASRSHDDILIHVMNTLMHNGAFSIVDAMNPDGTLVEPAIYSGDLKDVFAQVKPLEQYVSGNLLSDVAVLYHTEQKSKENFIQSPLNVASVLREKNILHDVIGCRGLEHLNAQVLCINDVPALSDAEMQQVEAYLNRGGSLFITGQLCHPRLEKLLGVRVTGKSEYALSYLSPTPAGEKLLAPFTQRSPYPIEHTSWLTEQTDDKSEVLATLAFPYTKRDTLKFASIHSDPPGVYTKIPAVIRRAVGSGTIFWVASPLELTKSTHCREVLLAMVESLMTVHSVISNAPAFVEVLAWEKEGHHYLGIVNQQEQTPVYPITDIRVEILGEFPNAKPVIDGAEPLQSTVCGGKTILALPRLHVYQMYQLD